MKKTKTNQFSTETLVHIVFANDLESCVTNFSI